MELKIVPTSFLPSCVLKPLNQGASLYKLAHHKHDFVLYAYSKSNWMVEESCVSWGDMLEYSIIKLVTSWIILVLILSASHIMDVKVRCWTKCSESLYLNKIYILDPLK